jgi:hypothetical protein
VVDIGYQRSGIRWIRDFRLIVKERPDACHFDHWQSAVMATHSTLEFLITKLLAVVLLSSGNQIGGT